MLLSRARDEHLDRIYVTRFASIITYFSEGEGGGMELHVQPGLFAYGPQFERDNDAVREAVLAEAARRLGVEPDAVLAQPYKHLKGCVDPDLDPYYRFAPKSSRGRFPHR